MNSELIRRNSGALSTIGKNSLLLLCAFVIAACSSDTPNEPTVGTAADYNAKVATAWFDLQLDAVQTTPGFSPPVASRAFGYSGVTIYEALIAGMPENRSLQGQINGLAEGDIPAAEAGAEYHWPSVANAAMGQITRHLYPNATAAMTARIDSLETALAGEFTADADEAVITRSIAYGRSVADAVFEYSKTDGGHEGYLRNFPTDYTPPTGEGFWVPTPNKAGGAPQSALQPYWGDNRPFVLTPGTPNDVSEPGAPPAYSEEPGSDFYGEAMEVYTTLQSLTPDQEATALYWSDDPGKTCTPPGHSVSIMTQCIEVQDGNLADAALCYAQVGMAVADAFIACWESKYRYNLMRPITYINEVIDPAYDYHDMPVNTPPFPEYTSGHSVQSGAAAAVLTHIFGPTFSFTDHTHDALGMAPRTYASFDAAAQEAAISRLYGGIHYRAAIDNGVAQGKKIGEQVISKIDWEL